NRLPEEMERQATLERLGWVFTRVRATEFLRDAQRAMQPVFDKLEMLEISPDLNNGDENDADGLATAQAEGLPDEPERREPEVAALDGLVERVIRRADELRQEWRA